MSKKRGWIKLHRSILDSEVFDLKVNVGRKVSKNSFDLFHAWVYLLLNARSQDGEIYFNGDKMKIKAGQLVVSQRELASVFGWSISKISEFLHRLEEYKMITKNSDILNGNATLITIENWGKYQDVPNKKRTQNEHKTNTKRTQNERKTNAKRTQNETNKNDREYIENDREKTIVADAPNSPKDDGDDSDFSSKHYQEKEISDEEDYAVLNGHQDASGLWNMDDIL